ncbi:hypothetical protein RV10_GL001910 [Enterococcus pallens]|nr:hypothetical protein RV10_GL001910 [Enterococcus pallens]
MQERETQASKLKKQKTFNRRFYDYITHGEQIARSLNSS